MTMNHRAHWLLRVRPALLASFLKKLLRVRRRVIETDHGRFFADPASVFGNALVSEIGYEPDLANAIRHLLQEGDTFIDVGANEGYFSILSSKLVGGSGKVVCIEPQSRLQSVIVRNMAENNAYNITLFQLAISDHVGVATLSLAPDMNTGASGLFRMTRYRVPTELVPQTTLSRLLSILNVGDVKLMKIDVEGLEYEAVLGSKELFSSGKIRHIALELHPTLLGARGKSGDDILDFLASVGYERNTGCTTLVLSKSTA
jgi:FkbM family methyltransferase